MRGVGFALAGLAVLGTALLMLQDDDSPLDGPRFPAAGVLSASDDWLRSPEDKVAAAAVDAVCAVSSGAGDLDGGGGRDVVLAYSSDRGCRNERVAIFRSDGTAHLAPIDTDVYGKVGETCPSGCLVLAVPDLNGDARDEVVLELSHGASQAQLGVYRLGPRGLVRLQAVTARGREPALFSVGGSVCCGGQVLCRGRDLVVYSRSASSPFGTLFVGETVYRFDGRRFVPISSRAETRAELDARGTRVPGRECIGNAW